MSTFTLFAVPGLVAACGSGDDGSSGMDSLSATGTESVAPPGSTQAGASNGATQSPATSTQGMPTNVNVVTPTMSTTTPPASTDGPGAGGGSGMPTTDPMGQAGTTGDGGASGRGTAGQGNAGDGSGGLAAGAGGMGVGGQPAGNDEMPWFSFFAASMEGLLSLAPDPQNGFGGDFGGLAGADEICTTLARNANPSDAKTWVAFLSTSGYEGGERVDAIDRVGDGPWYDFNGRLFAENVDGLFGNNGRPDGDPQLAEMFTDEYGEDIQPNDQVDNHDTLTGSDSDGRLFDDGADGEIATCHDWTDNTVRAEGGGDGPGGGGGGVPVGHSWPRTENGGRDWISEHTVNGCEPGINIEPGGSAPSDDYTVGAGGGFGGIYCFALGAVAP